MTRLLRPLLPALAAALALSSASAADTVTLKQQLLVGKRYYQTIKMNQATTIDMGQIKMDQKMDMTMEASYAVTKADDGKGKRVALKFDRMVMNMDMNGQKTVIDSSAPGTNAGPLGNPFAALTGKEIRMLVDENNKVTGFENFDEVVQAAGGASNPVVAGVFNKDALSKTIEQSGLQSLPNHPIKPGESWSFSVDMPMPQVGTGTVKGTYTYKGTSVHNGVPSAELAVEGKINFAVADGGSNPAAQMGMKIKDGSMSGTIWFDNALGTARDADIHQDMTMTMNNPTKPGETLTLPMKQTIHTELIKVEDAK